LSERVNCQLEKDSEGSSLQSSKKKKRRKAKKEIRLAFYCVGSGKFLASSN